MNKTEILEAFIEEMNAWASAIGDGQIPSRELAFSDSAALALEGKVMDDDTLATVFRMMLGKLDSYGESAEVFVAALRAFHQIDAKKNGINIKE